MTQEEKAKAYDEALELMKDCIPDENGLVHVRPEEIFPELKHSLDERIREAIIATIHLYYGEPLEDEAKEMVAWLERQGENSVCKVKIGETYKCIASPRYTCFYIGEIYHVTDNFVAELINMCSGCFVLLENQGEQKPSDKVEPKFEIGDLITNGILVGKIDEMHDWGYHAYFGDHYADVPDAENWHKWTIADAKDGDVLASNDGDDILIFRNVEDNVSFSSYYNIAGRDEHCWLKSVFIPASKEQRDLLFQKMKEAGYEWDVEKKELKKIEYEIEIPFGAKDSELQEVTYYIPKGFHAKIDDDKVVIKKGEKPITWSEEDEHRIKDTIYFLDTAKKHYASTVELDACINWLKSLKQRIGGEL